jgi:AP endonuclease 2
MFDILEADIVIMQETKIQRKDLGDDIVLVPGWDVYFSLPKHKKGIYRFHMSDLAESTLTQGTGYSGVAIYTRNSICAPIRAEEGITGILTPPNSSTSFFDLPKDQQIGGYPTISQLSDCSLDAATLDSEGRCVILEFPAFVLIGVYCPANRDETRDEFRIGFLNALDGRVRNLAAAGKRVVLAGDMNITRGAIDTAKVEEYIRKHEMTMDEFISRPATRMLNQLLFGGEVLGQRDEGREKPAMWDLCRLFHPDRRGMFTCWEQKINARPGNYGSRIDYVLCSEGCKEWFCESNIQEGLMGSDHCPVYAILKGRVAVDGEEILIRDIMSSGMFSGGVRQREWSPKDLLPTSAKLIPEFDRRRNIRDMFSKKPTMPASENFSSKVVEGGEDESPIQPSRICETECSRAPSSAGIAPMLSLSRENSVVESPAPAKRQIETSTSTARQAKRNKSSTAPNPTPTAAKGQAGKGQSSLMGFFKPKTTTSNGQGDSQSSATLDAESDSASIAASEPLTPLRSATPFTFQSDNSPGQMSQSRSFDVSDQKDIIDPIVSKESWSKLLKKRVVPRCDHNEPCISLVTKKPGVNCGRSFYICPRPLGPSGQKEKNTQWRCGTFIWSSDWPGDGG